MTGFAAGQAHERVAVGRRHVDVRAEELLDGEAGPLRRELGAAGEDAGDARLRECCVPCFFQRHGTAPRAASAW